MSGRKDYRVTVKVRNNNILKTAESLGHTSIPKLAKLAGISYAFLNNLVNMTESPLTSKGEVRWQVDKLCVVLNKTFADLFSDEQREAIECNRKDVEVNAEYVFAMMHEARHNIDSVAHGRGLSDEIDALLDRLPDRRRKVLEMRFGIGCEPMTLAQVADVMGVDRERIRQIEADALRKCRHPGRIGNLGDYLG